MKKLLSILLALTLCVVASFSFGSVSFALDDSLGTRIKNSETFYKYDGDSKTLYINGTGDIPNLSNSSIPWYDWDSDSIQSVVVSEGITAIGNYTFYQVGATSFSLPRTLKKIGRYALSCTSKATSFDLPFGIETIDDNAFYFSGAASIKLPQSLKKIGMQSFYNCRNLKSINIPSAVSSIGKNAFSGCSSLEKVVFDSLTQTVSISQSAFIGCKNLKSVNLPMYASCGTTSLGYIGTSSKTDGFTLGVFKDSLAYNYALGNGIAYTLLDEIPLSCGIKYDNSFTDDNISDTFHYTFTPDTTQKYVLYSLGDCDTYAKLYLDGKLVAENDDIDKSLNGFGIKETLVAGKTYDLYVTSVKMTGNFSVLVFPQSVENIGIYSGKITVSAADGKVVGNSRIFTITDDMLADFVIDLTFADGTACSTYFAEYIAGEHLKIADNQYDEPFVCGNNKAKLSFGDRVLTYDFVVEHSYAEKYVEPTVDDDGYTLHYCVYCGKGYKENFVPTTSFVVTGKCVMDEDDFGNHPNNVPYSHAYITVDGRRYNINPDGTWSIRTFDDCYITFNNLYGGNSVKKIEVSTNGSYDFGTVALEGYDINGDGYVNAKDYAIYYREMREELGEDYWQFGANFLIWQ